MIRRRANAREKAEQAIIKRLYAAFGCEVFDFSQPRATMQTAGIPDLFVFHTESRRAWWHEVKAPGGRLSAYQILFRDLCTACSIDFVWGDYSSALAYLIFAGIASEDEGALRRNRDFPERGE